MSRLITISKPTKGLQTQAQICAKIDALEAVLSSLYETALVSVNNGHTILYDVDTGQGKQRVEYTTPNQVIIAIDGYEKLIQKLRNKLIPRSVRLVDGKSM